MQKVISGQGSQESRSLGAQFVNNTLYTAVWVAAVCLFMELLGFSTQKWLTAGGLGTVLLTLAGREIFTNFLSSIMIHATRPFVLNEWIQTKIDGYEVSGTVEHVGWWSPTIIRGDDREAVHIPNHKFTVSIVRNLTQKSHWRIKTHFGISHLDVSKVPNIVADMRKVLAKHPQVEQRRLHRRVFFETIDPENQAIMILVSCFVKTSHFEEYLRVKEVILLDLLKVISHHHARLATPIRSVQRVQDDVEPRTPPFRDINRSAEALARSYLLVETTAISSGQQDGGPSGTSKNGHPDAKEAVAIVEVSEMGPQNEVSESSDESKVPGKHKTHNEGIVHMGLSSIDISLLGVDFEGPAICMHETLDHSGQSDDKGAVKSDSEPVQGEDELPSNVHDQSSLSMSFKLDKAHTKSGESSSHQLGKKSEKASSKAETNLDSVGLKEEKSSEQQDVQVSPSIQKEEKAGRLNAKQSQFDTMQEPQSELDVDQGLGMNNPPVAKLEENLVLGVALDGPKRTLPLDEVAPSLQHKELVVSRNGNSSTGNERRDRSQVVDSNPTDIRER
ncbi:hypothetical protein KP509_14G095500 [Ceratopteris richardii]|nr:hypothetical protein KP509_14G095500 [Ceratopteris richardii]